MNKLISFAAKATALWLTEVSDKFKAAVAAERFAVLVAEQHKRHSGEGWDRRVIGCPLCEMETEKAGRRNA